MSAPARPIIAWEPFTPRGIAAFAGAGLGWLLLVQFIVALLAAGVAVWFINNNCFTVINTAVQKLPAAGEIRSGKLDWPGRSPELLARGRFLALDVDLDHTGQFSQSADVRIEFGNKTVQVYSLLGYQEWHYPSDYVIAFNRNALEPLWGAWAMELLLLAAVAVTVCLLLCWWLLATIYF